MRILHRFVFVLFCLSLSLFTVGQSVDVTFSASVKNINNNALQSVYVRIFSTDDAAAVDSFFTTTDGTFTRTLPFTWNGTGARSGQIQNDIIITPLSPNLISGNSPTPFVKYNYPEDATIRFMDIQGKEFSNSSEVSPGLYFYYLQFQDGTRSDPGKIMVGETCHLDVQLINIYTGNRNNSLVPLKKSILEDVFYAELTKEGYVSIIDTIVIDTSNIHSTYQMVYADTPTAEFAYSGTMVPGTPVVFDASESFGANGEDLVYFWDFGDGNYGQSAGLTHIFAASGTYDVTLTIAGDFGATSQITKQVIIYPGQTASAYNGSVIASIMDMDLLDMNGATVSLIDGSAEGTTDHTGTTVLSNLPVGIPLYFRVSKAGYVNQLVELTIPEDTKEALFFASLKTRNAALTLANAEFGGSKTGQDGTSVSLPVKGLIRQDGTPVTGNVSVSITPIDVAYESSAFPGTFAGYRTDGEEGVLLSLGVSEFHFQQGNEELQLAPGKTASIQIPIYTTGATLGDVIPLWSVDEESGVWTEEGSGTVVASDASPTGLAFQAEVGHFSWWNCDFWEVSKKKSGLCYRFECTSAICVKVKTGCWMSGAMKYKKEKTSRVKSANQVSVVYEDREDIEPVFEVRQYVSESGMELRFPGMNDVLIDARGFSPEGELLVGAYLMEGAYTPDTFSITLAPAVTADTIDLQLNKLSQYYLEKEEVMVFRTDIPAAGKYRVYFMRGESPYLYGLFAVVNNGEILIENGVIGTYEHWVNVEEGSLIITITGYDITREGNFMVGVAEEYPMGEGDTLNLGLNSMLESYIAAEEYKHFRVQISSPGLYMVDMVQSDGSSLDGRFEASNGEEVINRYKETEVQGYFYAEPGEYFLSVGGNSLTTYGGFHVGVWETSPVPIESNDSIYASMSATDTVHIYSFTTDNTTTLTSHFYVVGQKRTSGKVRLLSPEGIVRDEDYLYATNPRITSVIYPDSTYYFEVYWITDTYDYVLITEEDPSGTIEYGDTLDHRLRYEGDINLYFFDGTAGDQISVSGLQYDSELRDGYFALLDPNGKELARRDINYYWNISNYEFIYVLPESGKYSIKVSSTRSDTGSYRIMLKEIQPQRLVFDELLEMDVENGAVYYLDISLAERNYFNFAAICDVNEAKYDVFGPTGEELSNYSYFSNISYHFNGSFNASLEAGRYYIRIINKAAKKLYLTASIPKPLTFNTKGLSSQVDTIHHPRQVNTYYFHAKPGTGVNGLLWKNGNDPAPKYLEMDYYRPTNTDSQLYPRYKAGDSRSLDTTLLYETGAMLTGEQSDTTWILATYATSASTYRLDFYKVAPSNSIIVDDDFAEYPDAQTASPVAAGFAVTSPGTILIANGRYKGYLPVQFTKDNISIAGQSKENVHLYNIFNYPTNQVFYLTGENNTVRDMTLHCGDANYYSIENTGENHTLDNILVDTISGFSRVSGGIRVLSTYGHLNNITLNNSWGGLFLSGNNTLIENCNVVCEYTGITANGADILVRNNYVEVTMTNRGIELNAGSGSNSTIVFENNTVKMTAVDYSTGYGIFQIENLSSADHVTDVIVRNNTIESWGANEAFFANLGNPPARIFIENNTYHGFNTGGGRALSLNGGRTDGVSTILVRNNTFDGLSPEHSIVLWAVEYIKEGEEFGIYNNSFRVASTIPPSEDNSFIYARNYMGMPAGDTIDVKFVNNIFQGNGNGSFVEFENPYGIYSDYNIIHNFGSMIENSGTLLGSGNDRTDDPLFTDEYLHVGDGSPALNNGASSSIYEHVPAVDKDGVSRPQSTGVDIGAYER